MKANQIVLSLQTQSAIVVNPEHFEQEKRLAGTGQVGQESKPLPEEQAAELAALEEPVVLEELAEPEGLAEQTVLAEQAEPAAVLQMEPALLQEAMVSQAEEPFRLPVSEYP